MGLLDKKERIIDLILTDRGRELLSKGLLDFTYYAFSDEGVDYKALSDKGLSGSLDDAVYRNIAFEADRRTNQLKQPVNNKLNSFLFTIPNEQKVVPELRTNKDDQTSFTITRQYYSTDLNEVLDDGIQGDFISVVAKFTTQRKKNAKDQNYILDQLSQKQIDTRKEGKNTVGMSYDRDHFVINSEEALDTTTGLVEKLATLSAKTSEQDVLANNFSKKVDVVTGLESEEVVCRLKSGKINDGFLVEVFESGSQGYKKLDSATIMNKSLNRRINEGYDLFVDLIKK